MLRCRSLIHDKTRFAYFARCLLFKEPTRYAVGLNLNRASGDGVYTPLDFRRQEVFSGDGILFSGRRRMARFYWGFLVFSWRRGWPFGQEIQARIELRLKTAVRLLRHVCRAGERRRILQ